MKVSQEKIVLLSGALCGFALVCFAGQTAPGITFDSRNYLYAAESVFERGIFVRENNLPFIEHAPAYPLLLALLRHLPTNFLQTLVFFQAGLLAASLYCIGKISYPFFQNKLIFSIFYAALAFGSPLLLVYHFIWTEGLFVTESIGIIAFLLHFYQKPLSLTRLLLVLLTGMALCMSRYAGIFFIPGVALLLASKKKSFFTSLRYMVFYFLIMAMPVLLWWLRNKWLYGRIMGSVSDHQYSVSAARYLMAFLNILTSWWLPDELSVGLRMVLVFSVLVFLIKHFFSERQQQFVFPDLLQTCGCLFTGYFLLIYPVCVAIAVGMDEDERMLAPVYVPGMLFFFLLADSFISKLQGKPHRIALILLLCWATYPVARGITNTVFWNRVSAPIYLKLSER